jgi:hypothetical protein
VASVGLAVLREQCLHARDSAACCIGMRWRTAPPHIVSATRVEQLFWTSSLGLRNAAFSAEYGDGAKSQSEEHLA